MHWSIYLAWGAQYALWPHRIWLASPSPGIQVKNSGVFFLTPEIPTQRTVLFRETLLHVYSGITFFLGCLYARGKKYRMYIGIYIIGHGLYNEYACAVENNLIHSTPIFDEFETGIAVERSQRQACPGHELTSAFRVREEKGRHRKALSPVGYTYLFVITEHICVRGERL